jgi:hypothetical protein
VKERQARVRVGVRCVVVRRGLARAAEGGAWLRNACGSERARAAVCGHTSAAPLCAGCKAAARDTQARREARWLHCTALRCTSTKHSAPPPRATTTHQTPQSV